MWKYPYDMITYNLQVLFELLIMQCAYKFNKSQQSTIMSLKIVTLHQSTYINIPMSNSTLNNHLDSGNIATRVKAKNEKARKNFCSQEITTF